MNHPNAPGEMTRVGPNECCRRFRAKRRGRRRHGEREPADDEIRYIALTQGRFAMVDAADYAALGAHKWTACFNRRGTCYAFRRQNGRTIYMHREVMQTPPGLVADHISANPCNNCRHNLRNCTQQQNVWNGRGRGSRCGFKGVCYDRKRRLYEARIAIGGEKIHLGWFADPAEAARVRDRKARELCGPYAYLNFPPEDLERPRPRFTNDEACIAAEAAERSDK